MQGPSAVLLQQGNWTYMIKSGRGSKPSGALVASSAPRSPWLGILKTCVSYTVGVGAVASIVAWPILGAQAAGSLAFGCALIVVFFGISLLVADWAGRHRASWALPAFLFMYFIKVLGMGFLVLFSGLPEWVLAPYFMWGAIGSLVLWQVGEIRAFSRARLPIFNQDDPSPSPSDGGDHGKP
jgi:ATP synthase protein I